MADRIEHPDEERDVAPVFLTIGSTRVYCIGCKSWQPTEGYCEGDPDMCPIGEEDQGRSPSLAEAQEAIDKLASELNALDEHAAGTLSEKDATIAALRQQLTEAQADRERLGWLLSRHALTVSCSLSGRVLDRQVVCNLVEGRAEIDRLRRSAEAR